MDGITHQLEFLSGSALADAVEIEKRKMERRPMNIAGRLAYGGLAPGIVGCNILDLSETGVRVEIYTAPDEVPKICSLEFSGIYCRARRRWVKDKQIGLEFIFDLAPIGANGA